MVVIKTSTTSTTLERKRTRSKILFLILKRSLLVTLCVAFLVQYRNQKDITYSMNTSLQEELASPSSSLSYADRMYTYTETYQYKKPQLRTKSKINDQDLCGPPPNFPNYFKQRRWVRSQFGEEQTLYKHLFYNKDDAVVNKTFVELGAFDGMHWSNTRFFEYCLGWKGVLIEASPQVFPKLIKNRPYAHSLSFAPSCQDFHSTLTFEANAQPASAVVSSTPTAGNNKAVVTVPCGPLGPVLKDLFMNDHERITLFSLDVEGSEPSVLRTIDFDKIQVDVWIIESARSKDVGTPQSVIETREIMESNHYRRYGDVVMNSDLFIHKDSPYQLGS